MINIFEVILHLFKNLDKVAVRRLMVFQIMAEIIRGIFIGNIINFVAERLKKQHQKPSSTHMAVVRRLVSLCHMQREGARWEKDLEQDTHRCPESPPCLVGDTEEPKLPTLPT